jgi:16S rRNA (cytosine967-C5)-methyltransferase
VSRPELHPRGLAAKALGRVLGEGEPLDEAIEAVLEGAKGVSPQSRAWLLDVCSGALRWKGRLDAAIDSVALKKKPSGSLRRHLLVAAYQLIAQDRAAAAPVVSEAVTEIKKREGEAQARFANAALRKLAEHAAAWRAMPLEEGASEAQAAAWASLPEWLWKRLLADHGPEFARAFSQACLERPTLWLRLKPGAPTPASGQAGPVPGSWRMDAGGRIDELAGFSDGDFIVQDISSQVLVHEIAARAREVLGGGSLQVLDLCAAPGGKSVGLAWEGFRVSASDRDSPRMRLLENTEGRVKAGIQIVPKSEVAALPAQDLVWVDAPCSGTGIVRRHPDARWLKQPKDFPAMEKTQATLVQEGWEKVRPGGLFAYSVCSVIHSEGEGRTAGLAGAERVAVWELGPQKEPGGDGFWAGLFRKV